MERLRTTCTLILLLVLGTSLLAVDAQAQQDASLDYAPSAVQKDTRLIAPGVPQAVLDDFNRDDGPIGPDWTNQAGTFEVFNMRARGGDLALATYNGGMGNVLEADVYSIGTDLQYVALVSAYADLNNNYFIKVQQQNGTGNFEFAACYYGNNSSGGQFGLGFFEMDTPFAEGHLTSSYDGVSTVTVSITDAMDVAGNPVADQTYVCDGAPATGGTGIGMGGLFAIAQLDNYASDVGGEPEEYDFELLDEFGFLWLADAVAGETPCEGVGTALDGIVENVYVNGATMSGWVCKTPRELEITAVNNRGDGCELETDSFTYTGTRIGPNQWGGDWVSFCEGIGVIGEGTWTGEAVKNFKGDTPPMRVSFAGGNPARVDGLAGKQVAETPTTYALEQNYPNPFNPTTMVAFQLPEASEVSVRVFNALGQEVATLVDGYREAGRYEVSFDATELSAGVYLYSIEAEGFRTTKQMVLLK